MKAYGIIRRVATQTNAHLREDGKLDVSPHVLRHPFLRKRAETKVYTAPARLQAIRATAAIPTVSLALISLVASSCGYYTGQIEHRAAQ